MPAHLTALRRTRSGPFGLDEAIDLTRPRDEILRALAPLSVAAQRVLPVAQLTGDGTLRARQGKRLGPADFTGAPPPAGDAVWLDPAGTPAHLLLIERTPAARAASSPTRPS